MKYTLIETEKYAPGYRHEEAFGTLTEAQARMKELYRELVIEGDYDAIEEAGLHNRCGYVLLNDGNEISWDIEDAGE